MKYKDSMHISEMVEGEEYPITQGSHGYSDGVWISKSGDEITLRHFWTQDSDNFYFYDEKDEVWYPKDKNYDQFDVYDKAILTLLPDDMTLSDFYEDVHMAIYDKKMNGDTFPEHLKKIVRTYSRDKELLYEL